MEPVPVGTGDARRLAGRAQPQLTPQWSRSPWGPETRRKPGCVCCGRFRPQWSRSPWGPETKGAWAEILASVPAAMEPVPVGTGDAWRASLGRGGAGQAAMEPVPVGTGDR